MIDIATSMDILTTSKKDQTKGTAYQINNRSSFEDKRVNAKHDLIFDTYIDTATMRHMTILTAPQHTATQDAMRRLLSDNNTSKMEIVTSSLDKKRFRFPPRETSAIGQPLMEVEENMPCCSNVENEQEPIANIRFAVENDESTYTSKRVKRNNDSLQETYAKNEEWNFIPYPNHKDIDITLDELYGISEMLKSWEQFPNNHLFEAAEVRRQTDELGPGCIDDVENALLDFHVTSDDWNVNNIISTTNDKEQGREGQDLTEYDKVLPSDSSSVSSISFLEQQHVPPPALLRVTTSKILEEQELIWKQIKQEHDEPFPAPSYNFNSVWHHEVTRGHHIRPPLSPQSRRSNLCSATLPSLIAKESDTEFPQSYGSLGFMTPTSEKRKSRGVKTLPLSNSSLSVNSPVRPAHITPTKVISDAKNVPDSLFAPCLGCQTQLQFPLPGISTVVYCIQCGMMASSDLMRLFMEIDEEQNSLSFENE